MKKIMSQEYKDLVSRLREVVDRTVPSDSNVIVISKGDEELLKLSNRQGWHFPQLEDGRYAGYYPAKSAEAIAQLEALCARGADFLVIPSTAFWWFNHYVEFKQHLESSYRLAACQGDACAIFALEDPQNRIRGAKVSSSPNEAIHIALTIQTIQLQTIQLQAIQLESGGIGSGALDLLRSGISQFPASMSLVQEFHRIAAQVGDFAAAHEVLLGAVSENNAPPRLLVQLAEASLAVGDLDQAFVAAKRAIELVPQESKATQILAAVKELRQDPKNPECLAKLIRVERTNGRLALAEHYAVQGISRAPDDHLLNREFSRLKWQQGLVSGVTAGMVVNTLSSFLAYPFSFKADLIFDLGFHVGQDTEFYLKKGFRVVAVEANPFLTEVGARRFSSQIETGQLTLVNLGVGLTSGRSSFYLNQIHSEWSSFDHKIASRGCPVEEVVVETVTTRELLAAFGVPYYLKIDIEDYDKFALSGLAGLSSLPRYISVENGGMALFEALVSFGYTDFKFINQAKVPEMSCPVPAKEGLTIEHQFPFGSSGPFGEETPGEWTPEREMRRRLQDYWDRMSTGQVDATIEGWFDLHARWPLAS